MNLGKKIISLRKKEKLSQESLAELLGVTRQTISNWELDITKPDIKQIKEISKKFHISIDELLDNDIKDVIVSKVTDTQKIVNKNTKTIKIIIITIYFIILISIIMFTIHILTKKDFTKKYQTEFNCISSSKEIFNVSIEIEDKIDNIDTEEKYLENLATSNAYIVINKISNSGEYNELERYYAGKSLSEILDSLEKIKKITIEELDAKCR